MFYGGELVYAILAPLTILGVVVLAILALAGRSDADTRGERAYVLYLSLVSFVALFTILFAVTNLASTAVHAIVGDVVQEYSGPSSTEIVIEAEAGLPGEARTREALNEAAVALAAAGVLLFHRSRTRELVADPGFAGSAGARTFNAYLYAVSFVAMAILIGAVAIAIPALVRTIAPGLTALESSTVERDLALMDLVPAVVAGGAGAVIYLTHWRAAHRLRRGED